MNKAFSIFRQQSICLLFLFYSFSAIAQNQQSATVSFVKESTKLLSPSVFGSPLHPGIEFGYENHIRSRERHQLLFTIKMGYYFHKELHHGLTLKTGLSYIFQTKKGWNIGAEMNLGGLHHFVPKPIFSQDANGIYNKTFNWGKSKWMPSLGLQAGYQLSEKTELPFDVFLKYELGIEMPFAKGIDIPLFPHSFVHLGTRWPIKPETK